MEYTDDIDMWKATLLHDAIEDSKEKEKVTKEIYERCGKKVLKLCLLLTKNEKRPEIDSFDGKLRSFLKEFYKEHEDTYD
jgi:(p)ppGpp synthase/HD superfamily hydrolase